MAVLVLFAAGSASAAKRPAASAAGSGSMTHAILIPATSDSRAQAHVSVMFTSGFARIDHINASTFPDDSALDLLMLTPIRPSGSRSTRTAITSRSTSTRERSLVR
jgi:hypothetical protein